MSTGMEEFLQLVFNLSITAYVCWVKNWGKFLPLESEKPGFFGATTCLILVKLPRLSELCKLDKIE